MKVQPKPLTAAAQLEQSIKASPVVNNIIHQIMTRNGEAKDINWEAADINVLAPTGRNKWELEVILHVVDDAGKHASSSYFYATVDRFGQVLSVPQG